MVLFFRWVGQRGGEHFDHDQEEGHHKPRGEGGGVVAEHRGRKMGAIHASGVHQQQAVEGDGDPDKCAADFYPDADTQRRRDRERPPDDVLQLRGRDRWIDGTILNIFSYIAKFS